MHTKYGQADIIVYRIKWARGVNRLDIWAVKLFDELPYTTNGYKFTFLNI